MNATVRLIWQTAINLGFDFNESDAHDMYLELKNNTIEQKKDIIIADTKELLSNLKTNSYPRLTLIEQLNIDAIAANIEELKE